MAEEKKKRIFRKLKNRYRLVIMNDDTFEEKASWKLTPLNVFVSIGTFLISFTFLLTYVIAFTPLREYIPGYADVTMQRQVHVLGEQVEDIVKELKANDLYIQNIKNVVTGDNLHEKPEEKTAKTEKYEGLKNQKALPRSTEDSLLRSQIESEGVSFSHSASSPANTMVVHVNFVAPADGQLVHKYNPSEIKGQTISIEVAKNTAIKAAAEGTVIFTNWTAEDGYVIGVQHAGNFVTIYKNNSALLKKTGSLVKAGDAIAMSGGNDPAKSILFFELWYNGVPVNPENYMSF